MVYLAWQNSKISFLINTWKINAVRISICSSFVRTLLKNLHNIRLQTFIPKDWKLVRFKNSKKQTSYSICFCFAFPRVWSSFECWNPDVRPTTWPIPSCCDRHFYRRQRWLHQTTSNTPVLISFRQISELSLKNNLFSMWRKS